MSTSSWQLCFFFVFWMTVSVRSACLQGWDERDGSCFKVYNYQMKWSSGSQRCNSMYTGAHLIYVKDRTLDFLKKLTDFNTGHEYHVGGRKNSALIFKWGDGSLVKVSLIDTSSVGNYLKIKGWENGILMLYSSDENYSAKIICEYRPRLSTSSSSPLLPSSSLLSSSSSSSLQPLSSSSSSLQPLSSSSFSTYFLQPSTSPQALLSSSSSPPSSSSSSSSSSSLSLSLSSSSSSSSSLSPSLSLPSASLPSSSTLSSSLSASPSLSPSPSLSQSPSTSIHNVSSLSLSSDQTTRMEVLSPTSTRQRPSSSSIVNTANGETLISRFINDLNKLNISASTALEEGVNLTQIFLETNHKTQQKTENHLLASKELETFALRFTEYHLNNKEMLITTKNIVVLASNVRNASEDFVFLVPESTQTTQPTKVIIPIEDMNRKDTSIVVIHYSNLDVLVQKLQQDKRTSIQSHIIAATMKPRKNALVKNVTLGFNINESSSNTNHCNFWNFTTKVPGWSRDGCTVSKATNLYVECSCNHLTHFAVLMQVDDIKISEEHDNILTILTYIGLSLSILGCLLTFLAYLTLTDVQSEQSQIRMNLVAFLAVAHSLFLLNSLAKQYLFSCVAVAVLTQFFYTSALCWMCAEGVLLYQHIVKVFNTNLNMKHVYCSAWGIPTILVICSLSIAGNEDSGLGSLVSDDFCWLSVKNHLIWVFIAPVLMLILFNLVILGMVIKELSRISKPNCGSTLDTLRTNIKAFALLSPLLGLTWLTGLLCILGAGLVGVYIFTILNSTQGFFIFILYCLRSSEIRLKLQRKIKVMDESTPKKISSVPPVKTLNVQYKPTSSPQEKLVLSDFDQSGLKDTTTKETR